MELRRGEVEIKTPASREGVTGSYLTRVLRLFFLSPALAQATLAGRIAAVNALERMFRPLSKSEAEALVRSRMGPRWSS